MNKYKINIGDFVTSYAPSLVEYFMGGPRKVISIREVDHPEGNAIKCKGLKVEFWSNWLIKVWQKQ